MWNALAIILHLLAINLWIGGTFFSVVILGRATRDLAADIRYPLMHSILRQFFYWVWPVMLVLVGSGGWLVFSLFGNLEHVPLYVRLMISIALLMVSVFCVLFFGPYRRYQQVVGEGDFSAAQYYLGWIRRLSKLNMVLGICVLLAIGSGPHLLI
jgi:uncharacterized membrane protein